jgi:hypothetical protein
VRVRAERTPIHLGLQIISGFVVLKPEKLSAGTADPFVHAGDVLSCVRFGPQGPHGAHSLPCSWNRHLRRPSPILPWRPSPVAGGAASPVDMGGGGVAPACRYGHQQTNSSSVELHPSRLRFVGACDPARSLPMHGMAACGYEPPVEASKGASAMRSRSGPYERSMREWAPRRSAGGRLGRSPQRWHHGSPTDERDQEAEGRSPTPESLTMSVTMIILYLSSTIASCGPSDLWSGLFCF